MKTFNNFIEAREAAISYFIKEHEYTGRLGIRKILPIGAEFYAKDDINIDVTFQFRLLTRNIKGL